eukprot:scaffold27439_cov34-Tisochrysis_lutea.AAC.1
MQPLLRGSEHRLAIRQMRFCGRRLLCKLLQVLGEASSREQRALRHASLSFGRLCRMVHLRARGAEGICRGARRGVSVALVGWRLW